jgi:hypothetical protein
VLAEDDDDSWKSDTGTVRSGVPTPMAVSKLLPGPADGGLLDRSTRLLKLPLLEVSSCSLVVQSLATCTNTHRVTYARTHTPVAMLIPHILHVVA